MLFQAEGLTKEDKEQILEKINEISTVLRALEVRLNRHREHAPNLYRKLEESLQNSRRMSILYEE